MTLFLGVFVGYLVFMHFSDNFGRRFGMILTWSSAVAGFVLVSLSRNVFTASVGILMAGAGCESNMRISIAILSEIVDYNLRQKYSLILQCAFGVGGVLVSVGYYWLRNWREVTTCFCTLPAFVLLLVIVFYL
jgi:MFS family permease